MFEERDKFKVEQIQVEKKRMHLVSHPSAPSWLLGWPGSTQLSGAQTQDSTYAPQSKTDFSRKKDITIESKLYFSPNLS